jgi:hypothetical protein
MLLNLGAGDHHSLRRVLRASGRSCRTGAPTGAPNALLKRRVDLRFEQIRSLDFSADEPDRAELRGANPVAQRSGAACCCRLAI